MKKIFSLALLLTLIPIGSISVNADELPTGVTPDDTVRASTVTGNWYSGQEYDLNGASTVGTTNVNGSSSVFSFYLQDEYGSNEHSCTSVTVSNDSEYKCSASLMSPGSRAGIVNTGSTVKHQPWLNA